MGFCILYTYLIWTTTIHESSNIECKSCTKREDNKLFRHVIHDRYRRIVNDAMKNKQVVLFEQSEEVPAKMTCQPRFVGPRTIV